MHRFLSGCPWLDQNSDWTKSHCIIIYISGTWWGRVVKKFISQELFDLGSPNFVWSGSKVKVTINVKEWAGGLMPTSSCFIFGLCRSSMSFLMYPAKPKSWPQTLTVSLTLICKRYQNMLCDSDLWPTTLTYNPVLDLHTKRQVKRSNGSRGSTNGQTNRQTKDCHKTY